jgi:ABC-type bacteriocin/lantibiotic exporter with double-glycine peptidase domain
MLALLIATLLLPSSEPSGDVVCGPRCVEHICRLYHRDSPSLRSLVTEMGPDVLLGGATVAQLVQSLQDRSLHAEAVALTSSARPSWPFPYIVHLAGGDDAGSGGLGHFVVVEPDVCAGDKVMMWNGLAGYLEIPWGSIFKKTTGTLVLTAPDKESAAAAHYAIWLRRLMLQTLLCVTGVAVLAVAIFVRFRRKEHIGHGLTDISRPAFPDEAFGATS